MTRKTWLPALLTFLLAVPAAWSQGVFTALNGGLPIEAGRIDAAVSMKDERGVLYLLYLKAGELLAKSSADDGQSFAPYILDYGYHALTNVRKLTLLSRLTARPLAFFIADEEGSSGLYALSLAADGGLELFGAGRLDDPSVGSVTAYEIWPESPTKFVSFYLKSGSLRLAKVDMSGYSNAVSNMDISATAQEVVLFDVSQRYPQGHDSFVGTYLSVGNAGNAELHAFTLMDDGIADRSMLATGSLSGAQEVRIDVTINDVFRVAWMNGQSISTFANSGGAWQTGGAITVPPGEYSYFAVTDGRGYLPSVASYPGGRIFVASDATSPFQTPFEEYPVLRAPGGVVSSKGNLFLLAYLTEAGGVKEVKIVSYDFKLGVWVDQAFPTIPDATIVDAWFSSLTAGYFVALLGAKSDGHHVVVFQAGPAAPSFHQAMDVALGDVPPGAQAEATLTGEMLGDVLVVSTLGMTVLVNVRTGRTEIDPQPASLAAVTSAQGDSSRYLKRTAEGTFVVAPES